MKKIIKKTTKKALKYVNILGIDINSTHLGEVLADVEKILSYKNIFTKNRKDFYIVTPNPELVLASTRNPKLKNALNNASLAIPDGVGLNYASKFLYGRSLNIIPGRKFFIELIRLAERRHWRAFLLGGMQNEAEKAAVKLKHNYLGVDIMFDKGHILDNDAKPVTDEDVKTESSVIEKINKFKPHFLFVAFQNPKQEIWLYNNISRLNIGCGMAVGGTFRYVSGLSALPPVWMEKAGLEWLWRLVTEPARLGRVVNASVVFPWRVFLYKITKRI